MSCPRANERGAVFVEKLIVYLPLLAAFFATWELAELTSARLIVERASSAAGRAAVVVLPDDPSFYEGEETGRFDGVRRSDVELAAGMILSAHPRLRDDFEVDVSDPPTEVGLLEVSVDARYDCGAVSFFCADGDVPLRAVSRHAYQGARYQFTFAGDAASGGSAALVEGRLRKRGAGQARELGGQSQALGSKNDKGKGKDCSCTYVYRRDSRSPDEIFKSGFSAKGTNMDLGQHVEGSGQGGPSGYISTTKDERVAFKLFWQANETQFKDDWIYKIRECGKGVDVNKTLDPCKLPPDIGKKVEAYAYQEEVAIPGRIEPEDIVSATKPRKGDRPASIQPKPNMTDEEREAFLNWPPLDQVKVKGSTKKNGKYDKSDQKRQSSCTVM